MDDRILRLIKRGSRPLRPLATGVKETGRLPRAPRAVLFDVYGTLLARIGGDHPRPGRKRREIDAIVRQHGLSFPASGLEALLGQRIAEEHAALRARGVRHPEVNVEAVWAELLPGRTAEEVRTMIVRFELAAHPAWPMPGCRRTISLLARRGALLGIVSNAQFYTPLFLRAFLGKEVESLGFAPELCLYSFQEGVAKPDASLFDRAQQLLRRRGVTPEETLMVGNSFAEDVAPAARAGFMTVLAALDRRSFAAPRGGERERPDAVIPRLASLPALLPKHVQRRDL